MRGITIKLSEASLRWLRDEARATGRTIAALVRERLEASFAPSGESVHARTRDLAGCLLGSRRAASNERPKFQRS